jgi:iron complex transport system substrate-binding protein
MPRWHAVVSLVAGVLLALPVALSAQNPPKRLVSSAPSITEILFALGLGQQVVGVSEYCRYPDAARTKPRIGSYLGPNPEVILAMRPDVVFVEEVNARAMAALPAVGFRKVTLKHRNIADIYTSIETIAREAGAPASGAKLRESLQRELAAIEARTAKLPKRRVLFLVGRTPGTLQGMIAVGSGTYIDELIRIAGGVNALADAGPAYPNVSLETVLGRNPEVIIDRGDMAQEKSQSTAHEAEVRKLWRSLNTVEAVKHNRVHAVSDDFWVVPGPRMVEAARALARFIHPEAGL